MQDHSGPTFRYSLFSKFSTYTDGRLDATMQKIGIDTAQGEVVSSAHGRGGEHGLIVSIGMHVGGLVAQRRTHERSRTIVDLQVIRLQNDPHYQPNFLDNTH